MRSGLALRMLRVFQKMKTSADQTTASRRFPWKRFGLVVVLLAAGIWVAHPYVLGWALRVGIERAANAAGYDIQIGKLSSRFNRPVVLERVQLRTKDASQTVVDVNRAEFSFNWPWRAFFGEKRIFRSLLVDDMRAIWDLGFLREDPVPAEAGKVDIDLQFLPERVVVNRGNAEAFSSRRSWYLQDFSVDFNEERLGIFQATGMEIVGGGMRQTMGPLVGETAWKDGSLYLADIALRDGLKIENFEMQLARAEGLAFALETSLSGGGLRMDVAYGLENHVPTVDAAVWMSNVQVAPLAMLLGWNEKAEGVIKEGRLTFRGTSANALDGQASLRLAAQNFRWNDRGWESLELGASMIHRRLAVSNFSLRQKDNTLSGNGEVALAGGWSDLARAPFLLNLSASINNLSALAALLGSPFDEMTGRMSLSSSISGQDGKLGGYLSAEGSDMGFRKHPIESGKVEVAFANTEAQIAQCELWSGSDYLRAKGAVDIAAPHTYSGEVQANLRDIASYVDLVRPLKVPTIFAGAAQIRWQGDGSAASHSGAFNVALSEVGSEYTPGGLTGRFAGTYSPQNLYFSGFELEQGPMRFSSRATLAASGINLTDGILRVGGKHMGDANLFLPLDPFALLSGRSLAEAALPDKKVYASLQTRQPVSLKELLQLVGRNFAGEGKASMKLTASGSPANLEVAGDLDVSGLVSRSGARPSPSAQLRATVQVTSGRAKLDGSLAPRGGSPVTLKAETPLAYMKDAGGAPHWMNPDAPVTVNLDLPRAEVTMLSPFLPTRLQLQDGTVTGRLAIDGTVGQPKFHGDLLVNGGRFAAAPGTFVADNIRAAITFDQTTLRLERATGALASGMFDLQGEVSLADVNNPKSQFVFRGTNLLLVNNPGCKFLANADLKAEGDAKGGTISGSLQFVEGRIYRRLEITPLLEFQESEDEDFTPPRFTPEAFPALANWKLDVALKSETPFSVGGNVAVGQIIPDLRLTGTVDHPVPQGRIALRNTSAFLPYTMVTIREGYLNFEPENPWVPQLDIKAEGRALDYAIQAYAFGPLNERKLILRSEPPLAEDALILLLTTGMPPNLNAAPTASNSMLQDWVTGAFIRQLSPSVAEVGTTNSVASAPAGAPTTSKGRFELWRKLTLMGERGNLGGNAAGVTYQMRFQ